MEKIININMAGRVIPIEDAAYTLLKDYVESLHAHFAGEEGCDEIMADIEGRIAELMDERIKRGTPAINTAHIGEIQLSMGTAQDFATEDARTANGSTTSGAPFPQPKKRFVRDVNDKLLGGVCSGLAAWLNVDPALVRIVFAVLTLGGWGTGLLLYIALWIFVPAAALEPFRGKRLYRNPDDKVLGGVAGGLAAYFGKETWIFRLVFGLPLLLSVFSGFSHVFIGPSIVFGSLSGTFILIYIILWIVLPPAVTDFQKMEMRGEKVDLASIRQNVQSAMGGAGERLREWSGEVRESVSRLAGGPVRSFTSEAATTARPIANTGIHIIGLLLKIFLLCIAGFIAFALFAAVITYSFSGAAAFVNHFILASPVQVALSWATLILFLGVPIVALITWIIRRIMKVRNSSRYMGWTFGGLWAIGGICAAVFATSLAQEFRSSGKTTTEVATMNPAGRRLVIDVPGEEISYSNSLPWLHSDDRGWDISGDTIHTANVNLHTTLSPDSQYHVRMVRYALGRNRTDAAGRANSLSYDVRMLNDSVLSLGTGYTIVAAQKYRGQQVMIEVQVPGGALLRLNKSVIDKLQPGIFMVRENGRRRHFIEYTDAQASLEPDVDYVMGADGELTNPLHPGKRDNDPDEEQHGRRRTYTDLSDREQERIEDSTDRALERKSDSLDREMERLERAKERLEEHRL